MASDRPLFVGRNSIYLPNRYNVDMRYTRMVPLHHSVRAELVAEMKNVFNTEQMSGFNSVVTTDAARGMQPDVVCRAKHGDRPGLLRPADRRRQREEQQQTRGRTTNP